MHQSDFFLAYFLYFHYFLQCGCHSDKLVRPGHRQRGEIVLSNENFYENGEQIRARTESIAVARCKMYIVKLYAALQQNRWMACDSSFKKGELCS